MLVVEQTWCWIRDRQILVKDRVPPLSLMAGIRKLQLLALSNGEYKFSAVLILSSFCTVLPSLYYFPFYAPFFSSLLCPSIFLPLLPVPLFACPLYTLLSSAPVPSAITHYKSWKKILTSNPIIPTKNTFGNLRIPNSTTFIYNTTGWLIHFLRQKLPLCTPWKL
jgi:hypothetical protein